MSEPSKEVRELAAKLQAAVGQGQWGRGAIATSIQSAIDAACAEKDKEIERLKEADGYLRKRLEESKAEIERLGNEAASRDWQKTVGFLTEKDQRIAELKAALELACKGSFDASAVMAKENAALRTENDQLRKLLERVPHAAGNPENPVFGWYQMKRDIIGAGILFAALCALVAFYGLLGFGLTRLIDNFAEKPRSNELHQAHFNFEKPTTLSVTNEFDSYTMKVASNRIVTIPAGIGITIHTNKTNGVITYVIEGK